MKEWTAEEINAVRKKISEEYKFDGSQRTVQESAIQKDPQTGRHSYKQSNSSTHLGKKHA